MNNSIYNDRLGAPLQAESMLSKVGVKTSKVVRYRRHSRGFQKSPASQREIANLVRKSPEMIPPMLVELVVG